MIMTCILRYIDVRYMLPKRMAFAREIHRGVVDTDETSEDGRDIVGVEGESVDIDEDSKGGKDVRTKVIAAS